MLKLLLVTSGVWAAYRRTAEGADGELSPNAAMRAYLWREHGPCPVFGLSLEGQQQPQDEPVDIPEELALRYRALMEEFESVQVILRSLARGTN